METITSGSAALPLIAGFLTVWVAALVNRPGTSPARKEAIVIIIAVILGLLALVLSGQIVEIPPTALAWVEKIVVYIGLAIVASQGFYKALKAPAKTLEASVNGDPNPTA